MTEHEASRTLVKSHPELWAECSDAGSLTRHLRGSFGEIQITRIEPETTVVWEGELVSGTVRLEPAGWGTRVILSAAAARDEPESPVGDASAADAGAAAVLELATPEASEAAVVEPEAIEPGPDTPPHQAARTPRDMRPDQSAAPPPRRRGLLGWLLGFLHGPAGVSAPVPAEASRTAPPPKSVVASRTAPPPKSVVASKPVAATPKPVRASKSVAPSADPVDHDAVLKRALDSLGQAHHRPFSRG